jgi:hypothetical protein
MRDLSFRDALDDPDLPFRQLKCMAVWNRAIEISLRRGLLPEADVRRVEPLAIAIVLRPALTHGWESAIGSVHKGIGGELTVSERYEATMGMVVVAWVVLGWREFLSDEVEGADRTGAWLFVDRQAVEREGLTGDCERQQGGTRKGDDSGQHGVILPRPQSLFM